MNTKKDINDSLDEIKIYKPTPKRLCPPRKKINKSSSPTSSTTSNSNSDKSQNQFDLELEVELDESKMKLTNLNNISIEEINNDFLIYEKNLEEEECQNELWNILNNSSDNNFSEKINQNISKIKRCKNTFEEKTFEFLNDADMDDLFNEFNDMISNQK